MKVIGTDVGVIEFTFPPSLNLVSTSFSSYPVRHTGIVKGEVTNYEVKEKPLCT